jgi:TusA-related sulfurtransferase
MTHATTIGEPAVEQHTPRIRLTPGIPTGLVGYRGPGKLRRERDPHPKGVHMADESKPALTLDCIGLYCPEPLFQTRESIDSLDIGEVLEVFADDPAAEEDLRRFAKRAGHEVVSVNNEGGELHMLLRRLH